MKRQDKYPDTETFHFYNANSHNHYTTDCVLRAVCTALNQTWEQTLTEMYKIGLKYGYDPTADVVIAKYMESKGWLKCKQPRKDDNTKYTGKEFCKYIQKYSYWIRELGFPRCDTTRFLANIGGHHIVAIIDGKVNDIWDSTDGCIGNVWVKPI